MLTDVSGRWGRGGVAQSLWTHLIHNTYDHLHGFLDTNIYYSDDELRKQGELLVGKLVVTGQEAVGGSKQGMREDLEKKHISADPIKARLPCSILTRLVELRGCKKVGTQ